jgi:hypothetical protein
VPSGSKLVDMRIRKGSAATEGPCDRCRWVFRSIHAEHDNPWRSRRCTPSINPPRGAARFREQLLGARNIHRAQNLLADNAQNPTMVFLRREFGECRLKSVGIWQVMKLAAVSILCTLVVSCVLAPLPGDLRSAREACNREYPPRVGNYLPHARCVNAAVERYALPTASHPDLIRLQEGVRAALSEKVDRRQISVSAGERRMAEADRLVAVAERERGAGNDAAAARRVATIEEMLR